MNRVGHTQACPRGILVSVNKGVFIIRNKIIYGLGGWDLNGFRDIKPFTKCTGWCMPGHALGDFQVSVFECVLS